MVSECSSGCPLRCGAPDRTPSRRDFLSTSLLACVTTYLAACGDGNIGGVVGSTVIIDLTPPPPPNGPLTITLAEFPPLAVDGGIARVDGSSASPIAVTRVNATTFLAFSMICTHAAYRPIGIVPGVGFKCPNHGAEFASNGSWTGGEGAPDLRQYAVVLDADAGTLRIG
jgi:Rieske Fe-S protein